MLHASSLLHAAFHQSLFNCCVLALFARCAVNFFTLTVPIFLKHFLLVVFLSSMFCSGISSTILKWPFVLAFLNVPYPIFWSFILSKVSLKADFQEIVDTDN